MLVPSRRENRYLVAALEVLKLPHESSGLALNISGRSSDETDEGSLIHKDDSFTSLNVPPGNFEHR